ncbi:MAG TPA: DUF3293 domain-containing protein, partial [bacterium]|nr:DUF3293 domain-containing protein [bacterium]
QTLIPLETRRAYRRALYRVKAKPLGFILRVGRISRPLAKIFRDEGFSKAAFLTAYNPLGKKQAKGRNQRAHQKLVRELRRRGFAFIPGVGEDPDKKWAGETSLLVLGLSLAQARALGRRFRQNALVFAGPKALPRLVLLR